MRLDIQCSAVSRRETIQRHLEQRALFELARYGQYVGAVRMRVSGRGPSSEQPYHCGIAVTVVHDDGTSRHVLARSWGSDVFHLIDSVLGRAASLVGGEVERGLAAQRVRAEWDRLAAAGGRRDS